MTEIMDCPVDACYFEGEIPELRDHIEERCEGRHTWESLGYEDADEFCYTAHLKTGRQLQKKATKAQNQNQFDDAIEKLETALYHFQRASLLVGDNSHIDDQRQDVLESIDELETAGQVQVIDKGLNQAENAIDAGDERYFIGDQNAAEQKYDDAIKALNEAKKVATELGSKHSQEIDQQLRRVRVRQQSLESSDTHRSIRELVIDAREFATEADRAFHNSEYDVALEQYEKANEQYESLATALDEFSFDEPTNNSETCDVCQRRFDEELDSWQLELGTTLQVCPACARFGSAGNLPSPRDVAAEHRAVRENIESIRDGEVGLTWMSDEPLQSNKDNDSDSGTVERDTQQMIIQLVGLCQQLEKVPSAEELDEHTNFGYLAYRDEFGSLSEALQAAGFDS